MEITEVGDKVIKRISEVQPEDQPVVVAMVSGYIDGVTGRMALEEPDAFKEKATA